ncbi:uncharacterized protein LOC132708326 [Cylas formicarius]|uniref:uncharacterized protein LOC132708326 n=1 Tax=Cylas formicarius TaxID=197179 RepID=UPI0029587543|nr:uncharacterized protein LOC132708326 [Cylas formicarius]
MWLGEYILIYSGVERHVRSKEGVKLIIRRKLSQNIQEGKYASERIILVKLKSENQKTNTIGIYTPENCKPEGDRLKFDEKLQDTIDAIPKREIIIILGDFNARVGNATIAGVKEKFNESVTNENGESLNRNKTVKALSIADQMLHILFFANDQVLVLGDRNNASNITKMVKQMSVFESLGTYGSETC